MLNRTATHLVPIINTFGPAFIQNVVSQGKILYYIKDNEFYTALRKEELEPLLFLVIDINGKINANTEKYINPELGKKNFNKALVYFRSLDRFVWDYPLNWKREYHVIVLDIKEYEKAFNKFVEGKFSEMYTEEEIQKFNLNFDRAVNKKRKSIWKKEEEYREQFNKILNEEFKTDLILDDDRELDILIPKLEILNYIH